MLVKIQHGEMVVRVGQLYLLSTEVMVRCLLALVDKVVLAAAAAQFADVEEEGDTRAVQVEMVLLAEQAAAAVPITTEQIKSMILG